MSTPGERDLSVLLATLDVERRPGTFAYVSRPALEPALRDVFAMVDEGETITYVVAADSAPADAVFPCAWLTLTVESSLEAVGLTAAFAAVLAERDIPVNVLAGWHHDHILVPVDRAEEAIETLRSIASRAGPGRDHRQRARDHRTVSV